MKKYFQSSWQAVIFIAVLVFALWAGVQPAFSQTTISTGGIVGTVTDQTGALVPGAKVSITNKATGRQLSLDHEFSRAL